jgi:hypothetical protein
MDAIISANDDPGAASAASPVMAPPVIPQPRRPSLVRAALGFVASLATIIAIMIVLATPESGPRREASVLLLRGSL